LARAVVSKISVVARVLVSGDGGVVCWSNDAYFVCFELWLLRNDHMIIS